MCIRDRDDLMTAIGASRSQPAAEPKLGFGLDMSAVVKSERNPGPCEDYERVERALDAQVRTRRPFV